MWTTVAGTTNTNGATSITYQVCNSSGNCNFIAKRMRIPNRLKVQKEISKQKQFSDLGLAPKIVDVVETSMPYSVTLIMEKVDYMIEDYILSLPLNQAMAKLDKIEVVTLSLVQQFIDRHLIHGDLKLDNIGINLGVGENGLDAFKVKFIDFGFNTSDQDSIAELKMSFDMLRTKVRDKFGGSAQPIQSIFFNSTSPPHTAPERSQSPLPPAFRAPPPAPRKKR
jgi:serine/threonine protein kinase